LAIVLYSLIKDVLFGEYIAGLIIGAGMVTVVKYAQLKARRKRIVREANRAGKRARRHLDITGTRKRVPV
jgi:hypothetical protein